MTLLLDLLISVALLLTGHLFFERSKWCLHMLQLDSYSNARLIKWIGDRPTARLLDLPRHAWLALVSVLLFVLQVVLLRSQSTAHRAVFLASLGLVFLLCLALRILRRSPREEAKKPLVLTGRAKRILVATILVGAVLFVVAAFLFTRIATWPISAAILAATFFFAALLPLAAPISTLTANILLVPVQSAINASFVSKAKRNLATIHPTVVGITGSFGKTTTKYFLDALIRDSINTLKTPQSFNTLLGVCRVLNEKLRPGVKLFIAELGAYRPGDIKELAQLLHPTIGVLTAIGPQHLERFGSIEAVERTKFELIAALPPTGLAVFNFDDERCRRLATQAKQPVLAYGLDASRNDLDVWAEDVRMTPEGMTFAIVTRNYGRTLDSNPVRTPVLGHHNVSNILAATCVALHLGVPLDTLRRRMSTLEGAPHRLQLIKGSDGVTIIDDSYNSNPVGAAQALRVLGQFTSGKRILITPGMVELGSAQELENTRFGELAADACDFVFLVAGASSAAIHGGLRTKGFPEDHIRALSDLSGATAELAKIVQAGDVVLFANDLPDLYEAKA